MAKVSVIIPVYNVEPWLVQCLESIVGQSLYDIEIICVNDGSTDGSADILKEFAARDGRISIIDQENQGQSAARNAGMAAARGEYVYFMDSDDILLADALNELAERADAEKLDVLFFDAESFAEDGGDLEGALPYIRHNDYSGVHTGMELMAEFSRNGEYRPSPCMQLWRREHLEKIGMKFVPGIIHEDNIFTFRAFLHAARAGHMPKAYYMRRYRAGSTMTNVANTAHVTGLFISFMMMFDEFSGAEIPENLREDISRVTSNVLFGAIREYSLLDDGHKKALDWRGYDSFGGFFGVLVERMWDMYQSEEAIELRRTPYHSDEIVEKLRGDIARRREIIESIEHSASFRLGRIATFPLRAVRGVKNAMREGGVRNVVRRAARRICGYGQLDEVEQENRRLRAEIDEMKKALAGKEGGK